MRIPELDGTRGIAILSVIVANGFGAPLLWAGVDLFFVLSGFLITGILLRKKESGRLELGSFYARRAIRILPPYLLLLLISSLIFGTAWMAHWYWFAFFATNLAATLNQIGHPSLLPLWSLGVEEQFYLVWPLVVMSFSRTAILRIALALLIAAPLLRGLATPFIDTYLPIYYLLPFRMDLLASGAVLAWLYQWKKPLLTRAAWWPQAVLVAVAVFLVGLTVLDPGFRTSANTVRGNVLIFLCTNLMATAFVVTALTGGGLLGGVLRHPVLRYIGRISYSMYLVHQGALLLAEQILPSRIGAFLLALAVIIAYASATWFGFERRLLAQAPHADSAQR